MSNNDEYVYSTKEEVIAMLEYTTPECLYEDIINVGMTMEEAIEIYVEKANRQSKEWGNKPIFSFMDGLSFNLKWIEEEKRYVYCDSSEFFKRLEEQNYRKKTD